jgi:hypothetical protein
VHSPVTSAPDSDTHSATNACQLADGIGVSAETNRSDDDKTIAQQKLKPGNNDLEKKAEKCATLKKSTSPSNEGNNPDTKNERFEQSTSFFYSGAKARHPCRLRAAVLKKIN